MDTLLLEGSEVRAVRWEAHGAPGSGSVRSMPVALTSNTHASTIAIGNPTSRKMTRKVMAHSGTYKAGSTTEAASVTAQATAP